MRRKKTSAVAIALAFSLVAGPAWASGHDDMNALYDDSILTNQSTLDFGQVCASGSTDVDVTVEIVRGDRTESNQNYKNSTDVVISSLVELPDPNDNPAGTSLSAAADPINTGTGWVDADEGATLDTTATVTVTTGSSLGEFEFKLRFRGHGANDNNDNPHQVQSDNFKVVGEVIACAGAKSKAAPAIANEWLDETESVCLAWGSGNNPKAQEKNWRGKFIAGVAHEYSGQGAHVDPDDVRAALVTACASGSF